MVGTMVGGATRMNSSSDCCCWKTGSLADTLEEDEAVTELGLGGSEKEDSAPAVRAV
jgi:hypothetical protein